MGAKITGIASNLLTIEGVKSLKGCTHHVLPDMIEVGSFIGMAAMTSSEVTIKMYLTKIWESFLIASAVWVSVWNSEVMIYLYLNRIIMRLNPLSTDRL